MNVLKTSIAVFALAVLFHQSHLRSRIPIEALGQFDTLAECYEAWDELPASAQMFSWCSDKGETGAAGTGSDGSVSPSEPVE